MCRILHSLSEWLLDREEDSGSTQKGYPSAAHRAGLTTPLSTCRHSRKILQSGSHEAKERDARSASVQKKQDEKISRAMQSCQGSHHDDYPFPAKVGSTWCSFYLLLSFLFSNDLSFWRTEVQCPPLPPLVPLERSLVAGRNAPPPCAPVQRVLTQLVCMATDFSDRIHKKLCEDLLFLCGTVPSPSPSSPSARIRMPFGKTLSFHACARLSATQRKESSRVPRHIQRGCFYLRRSSASMERQATAVVLLRSNSLEVEI